MKRNYLTITLALFFISIAIAQKCKPRHIVEDDFTETKTEYWGNILTSMSYYSFDIGYLPSMFVFKENEKNKVIFGLTFKEKLSNKKLLNDQVWFEEGTKIILKLENEFIEFTVEKSTVNNAGDHSVARLYSSISTEQVEIMNTQKMEAAKIFPFMESEDLFFHFKIAKGRDKAFKKQLDCFLKL